MSKVLEDISRTFNEFLLLPNLTDERCIPSKVSLKTPLVKLDNLASKLGVKNIFVKDESYRY